MLATNIPSGIRNHLPDRNAQIQIHLQYCSRDTPRHWGLHRIEVAVPDTASCLSPLPLLCAVYYHPPVLSKNKAFRPAASSQSECSHFGTICCLHIIIVTFQQGACLSFILLQLFLCKPAFKDSSLKDRKNDSLCRMLCPAAKTALTRNIFTVFLNQVITFFRKQCMILCIQVVNNYFYFHFLFNIIVVI